MIFLIYFIELFIIILNLKKNSIITINQNIIANIYDNIENENSICLINYDRYDNLSHEIINIDINEKRKWDDLELYKRNIHLQSDESLSIMEMNIESFA